MSLGRAIRLLAVLPAAIAPALSASGCGGSAATALDPVAQAAQVTSHSGGAHMSLNVQLTASSLSQPFTMSGQGFFNYRSQEGKLSFDIGGLPAGAASALPAGGLHMEEIVKSRTVYVGSPLLGGLANGARWMKLDLSRVAQNLGFNLQQLAGGQANPAQFLEYLKAVGGTPERVASEPVRGVPTTHYRAAIALSKLADVLTSSNASQLRAGLAKLIAQLGASELPVDVWVDAQHLVRRIAFDLSFAPAGQRVSMRMNLELFDYGPTPAVVPPQASEVFDATQTALGALSGTGG